MKINNHTLSHLEQDSHLTIISSDGITRVIYATFESYENDAYNQGIYFSHNNEREYLWINTCNLLILPGHIKGLTSKYEYNNYSEYSWDIVIGGLPFEELQELLKNENYNEYFTAWDRVIYCDENNKEKRLFPEFKRESIVNYLTDQSYELISLYINARNYYKYITPIVHNLKKEILAELKLKTKRKETILEPEYIYRLEEPDRKVYYDKYDKVIRQLSLNYPYKTCPLILAGMFFRRINRLLAYHLKNIYPDYNTMDLERMNAPLKNLNNEKIYNKYNQRVCVQNIWVDDILNRIMPEIQNRITVLPEKEGYIECEPIFTKNKINIKLKDGTDHIIEENSYLEQLSLSNETARFLNDPLIYPTSSEEVKLRDMLSITPVILQTSDLKNVINLTFKKSDRDNCTDIFIDEKCKEYFRIVNKKDKTVRWTEASNGEPYVNVGPETVINIRTKGGQYIDNEEMIKEQDDVLAKKKFPFSWQCNKPTREKYLHRIEDYKKSIYSE